MQSRPREKVRNFKEILVQCFKACAPLNTVLIIIDQPNIQEENISFDKNSINTWKNFHNGTGKKITIVTKI